MPTLLRVINQQLIVRSILLDKIDKSQGNSPDYARRAKQKLYVPYVNPLDTSVKGYIDLVPTDEVLLQSGLTKGVITKLKAAGYITTTAFNSTVTTTSVVTSAAYVPSTLTINGTTFLSLAPDVTYVTLTNNSTGISQIIPQTAFNSHTGTQITILIGAITIGTPGTGWKVVIKANSKNSAQFTL